jgi:hypothetical protein
VNNEDQVPKRGKLKLGDPRPPNSVYTLTQVSLFLQKCLYSDTGVFFPPKVSQVQHRCLLPAKKCLYGNTGVSFQPKVSLRRLRCIVFIPKGFLPVLRIHDILGWIRIRGSMPLTNGSRSGSGFGSGSWIRILLFSSLTFKMPAKK